MVSSSGFSLQSRSFFLSLGLLSDADLQTAASANQTRVPPAKVATRLRHSRIGRVLTRLYPPCRLSHPWQSDFYETITADHEPVEVWFDDHYDEIASDGTLANASASAKTNTLDPELYVGFEEPSGDGYLNVDDDNFYVQPVVGAMSGTGEGAYAEVDELPGKQPVPPLAGSAYAEVDERTVATGRPMDDEDDGAYGVVLSASAI